ncbi:MAG TPA: NHL repeat-containing protein [Planctomycetota bacterium]|nr:NHL repeat-containing protein [Planctomycetota bacterium]
MNTGRKIGIGFLVLIGTLGLAFALFLPQIRSWYKHTFVKHDLPTGHLWSPMGMAIDPEGNIFVADQRAGHGRTSAITMYDRDRKFVMQFDHVDGYKSGDGEPVPISRGLYMTAIGPRHLVFVSTQNLAEIQIEGGVPKLVRTIGSHGSGPGQMDGPEGNSVDTNGDIYATDEHNRRINVFDREGKYLRSYDLPQDPQCVLVRGDRMYVSLNKRNYIVCYSKDGKEQFRIGTEAVFPYICWIMGIAAPATLALCGVLRKWRLGVGLFLAILAAGTLGCIGDFIYHHRPGQFRLPDYMCVSPDQKSLYVSDRWNHRVQVFDLDGHFKFTFGSHGTHPGHFAEPKEIAFDREGNVYVVDRLNDRVQYFTPEGKLLGTFD